MIAEGSGSLFGAEVLQIEHDDEHDSPNSESGFKQGATQPLAAQWISVSTDTIVYS